MNLDMNLKQNNTYCSNCIHKNVCKFREQVEKSEKQYKRIGTTTDYRLSPIIINCKEKKYDC